MCLGSSLIILGSYCLMAVSDSVLASWTAAATESVHTASGSEDDGSTGDDGVAGGEPALRSC